MKPSIPPRALAALAAIALLTSACSFLSVPNEVSVHKLPVDLTFGGETAPTSTPPPVPPLPDITDIPPVLPDDPGDDTPPPKPPPPICPPTSAIAPESAVASIGFEDAPEPGTYLFQFIGNEENGTPLVLRGYRTLENYVETEADFTYTVSDTMTGAKWSFRVEPEAPDASNTATTGLYLTKVELPKSTFDLAAGTFTFEPASPLKMLAFPIQPGTEQVASAPDVAPKTATPITNPLTGAPLLSPSLNAMQMTTTIGSPEIFEVCEDLAQAYKANIDLEMTGEYNVHILGAFYLWTQRGGWPIREDFVVSGDVMPGNFAATLMKLEPGDYL